MDRDKKQSANYREQSCCALCGHRAFRGVYVKTVAYCNVRKEEVWAHMVCDAYESSERETPTATTTELQRIERNLSRLASRLVQYTGQIDDWELPIKGR